MAPFAPPQVTAILTVRNEGAFLLDWLAHHRAAGIGHFVVFSNDCQDGTDALLDRLAALGWVEHHRNDPPYDKGGIQFTALKRAAKLTSVRQADWLLPLDVDEFVNVHTGDRTVQALISALPQATAITLTWRLFGNAGIEHFVDAPVPEQFTRAAPEILFWPWRAAMFKTLYRNDRTYKLPGVHRPRQPDKARIDAARWFDCEGRELGPEFRTKRLFSNFGQKLYGLAQLNHYPLGAMESYVLKSDRGRAVHAEDKLGLDYWVERNFCTVKDQSIAPLTARAAPIRAELAADPQLAPLHEQAVQWRHDRFEALMREEPNRALMGRLLLTPPTRPLPPEAARRLFAHARRGPGA
ncbi:glycosyltransferase family 2 protein [Mesobacterium pallidum]|uniref:glycosyltransferase family 2 protein n=1 Tax=Mesobacterium pallidum TaxID=2872037 RepID=UPI001EE30AC0|nr:glycosyltransferase family 2 protein [Mesobacterium pallidum]